jgi:exosome complex component RRP4
MAITILAPAPAVPYQQAVTSDDDDEDEGGVDLDGDSDMRPSKRARHKNDIVTPGETVTDDPQWMRYVWAFSFLLWLLIISKRPWNIHRLR